MLNKCLTIYKKIKFNKKIKTYKEIMIMHNSAVLLTSFNIDIRDYVGLKKRKYVEIGKDVMLACNITFEKETGFVSIGDRTSIGGGTNIISINKVEIGADVTIAWGCTIYDHNSHSIYWNERSNDNMQCIDDYKQTGNFIKNKNWNNVKSSSVKICDKVWIGFDCLILKGVTIGEGAVVGAKSVVTKDVPPYTVVAGNPARVVKTLEKEI